MQKYILILNKTVSDFCVSVYFKDSAKTGFVFKVYLAAVTMIINELLQKLQLVSLIICFLAFFLSLWNALCKIFVVFNINSSVF